MLINLSEELQIKVVGSLDANATQQKIQQQLNKIKDTAIELKIDNKALSIIKEFNDGFKQLEKVAKNSGKVIEEAIMPDGTKVKRTFFDGLDKEFAETTIKAKNMGKTMTDSFGNAKTTVDQLREGFSKLIRESERFNASRQKISGTIQAQNDLGNKKIKVSTDNDGSVKGYTVTQDHKKELDLIEQMARAREQSAIRKLADDRKLAESQAKAINLNRELLQQEKEKLELFKKNFAIDANKLLKTHAKTVDGEGLRKLMTDVEKLNVSMPNVTKHIQDAKLGMKQFRAEASEAARSSITLGEALETAMIKFPIWMAASTAIFGTIRLFKEMTGVIREVDDRLVSLKKVMDEDTNFAKLLQTAIDSSEKFARSVGESLDAMEEFAKQGYVESELKDLTEAGLVAANVAELSSQQASEYLTSSLIQWKKDTSEAMGIIDSWNQISNNYATTSEKLAQGHSRAGATAKLMNLTFDETNAILGTVTAATKQSGGFTPLLMVTLIENSVNLITQGCVSDEMLTVEA